MQPEKTKFLKGERIVATLLSNKRSSGTPSEEMPVKTYVGTVGEPKIEKMSDYTEVYFGVDWDDFLNHDPTDRDFPPPHPSFRKYDIQRLNPLESTFPELGEDFEKTLDSVYSSVRDLAKAGKGTKRATALATLRNLEKFLAQEKRPARK